METINLRGWVPYEIRHSGGQLKCHWLNTAGQRFTEPFFNDTILKCRTAARRYTDHPSVSSLEMLNEWAGVLNLNEVKPAALIFHISRCGSTLLSQLLATSASNIVLSEVPVFDQILQLPFKNQEFDQAEINGLWTSAIKYLTSAVLDNGIEKNQQLFIKTDSWHIFFYGQLRRLYPDVPFVLLYRNPDAVFRSHLKLAGMQAVPGLLKPALFGIKDEDVGYDREIHLARVLRYYLGKFLEIAATDERCILLNYNEGHMEMIKKIAAFTNIHLTADDLHNMETRSLYHSKKPGEHFSEENVTEIPACLSEAMDLYYTLDEKRQAMY